MQEGGKGPGRIPLCPCGTCGCCAAPAAAGREGALPERGGAPIRPLGGALSRPLSALGL